MNNRMKWLDFARGISVLLVVIGHMTSFSYGLGQWIYSFHMPIFFIISGILIYLKNDFDQTLKYIVIKKLKTIIFPYISISLINIIFNFSISLFSKSFSINFIFDTLKVAVKQLITTITFDGLLTLWFLPALFIAELLFYFCIQTLRKHILILPLVITAVVIFTSLFSMLNFKQYNGYLLYILKIVNIFSRALIGFLFLVIGFFAALLIKKLKPQKWVLALFGLVFLIINLILYKYNFVDLHYSIIGNPAIYYLNAICGSLAILIISFLVGKYVKIIPFFGKNSIVIFTTHLNFSLITLSSTITSLVFNIDNHSVNIIISFFILMIIETLLVLIINKFFKFIINYNKFMDLFHKNRSMTFSK